MIPSTMNADLFTTIDEARGWLKGTADEKEGAMCPCCDRFDKIYNYCVPRSAVTALANLCVASREQPNIAIHCNKFTTNSGAVAKLRHIDLIYQPEKEKFTGGKTGGTWAITQKGIEFVQGIIPIPTHLIIYHDELIGVSDNTKFLREYWPDFNYREMMNA